jgi:hypothetical protein
MRVVQPELEPARPAGPRTDLITHRAHALPTSGIAAAAAAAAAIAGAADVGPRGGEEDVAAWRDTETPSESRVPISVGRM